MPPLYSWNDSAMSGFKDLKKGMFIREHLVGDSVMVTRKVWMCKAVMTHRAWKMIIYASSKRNIGRKTKLTEKGKGVLKFIVTRKHKQFLYQKTSAFKIISRIRLKQNCQIETLCSEHLWKRCTLTMEYWHKLSVKTCYIFKRPQRCRVSGKKS